MLRSIEPLAGSTINKLILFSFPSIPTAYVTLESIGFIRPSIFVRLTRTQTCFGRLQIMEDVFVKNLSIIIVWKKDIGNSYLEFAQGVRVG